MGSKPRGPTGAQRGAAEASISAELVKDIRKQARILSELARGLKRAERMLADGCTIAEVRALVLKLKLSSKAAGLSRFAGHWK